MPVVATRATPIVVTVDQVRRFMRDSPALNVNLDDVQFSQAEINQGVEMVTSAYNSTTPLSNISIKGWPGAFQYLLLLGVTWYLIKSESILQLRNQVTYQDGDIAPIGVDDKYTLYMALWQALKGEWDEQVKLAKTQLNLESCYGSLSSGYLNVSRQRWGG